MVANLLWSDTDTIASMAGALIGAAKPDVKFIGEIQDEPYIRMEANRLFNISQGDTEGTFPYPDTLYWQAPRAAIDTLTVADGQYVLQGFGPVLPVGQRFKGRQKGAAWQWFASSWGQSFLIRMRAELGVSSQAVDKAVEREKNIADLFDYQSQDLELAAELSVPDSEVVYDTDTGTHVAVPTFAVQDSYMDTQQTVAVDVLYEEDFIPSKGTTVDIDALSTEAIKSFDPELIGQHLLLIAEQPNGVTLATGYASIVAKARATRLRHRRG